MRFIQQITNLSLIKQLILTFMVALLASFLLVAAIIYITFVHDNEHVYHHLMQHQSNILEDGIQLDRTNTPVSLVLSDELEWVYQALPSEIKYRIVDSKGKVLIASDNIFEPIVPKGKRFNIHNAAFDILEQDHLMHVVTTPIQRVEHQYFLQLANSDRLFNLVHTGLLISVMRAASMSILVSLCLVSLALIFTLRRVLKPLHALSADAAGISPRNLQKRIDIQDCPSELHPLITAFNHALSRLEQGYKVQQEFLATAAHELKTPLALIRGQVEMAEQLNQTSRAILLSDIDFMARQVHQLLQLAEVSEVQNYQFKTIDVNLVIIAVSSYLQRVAEQRKVGIHLNLSKNPVMLHADESALFILVKNLVENAIFHTPQDEIVVIHSSHQCIAVHDYGQGIPENYLAMLFQRFWRGPERLYEGAGLGLAICKEIAVAHSWSITASNTTSGGLFTVYFHDQ